MRKLYLAILALLIAAAPLHAGLAVYKAPRTQTHNVAVVTTTSTTLAVTVLVGPKTCTGGDNDGTECRDDTDCTGDGTCTGSNHRTFLDSDSGTVTTTIQAGTLVTWTWVATSTIHDVVGGTLCDGGSNDNGPCDADDRACVGGTNTNGACTSDANCPGSTCGYHGCWVCAAGSSAGKSCFTNVSCPGSICNKSGACTKELTETWDSGAAVQAPHSFSHFFRNGGTYPYVCGIHPGKPGATNAMTGVIEVQ